MLVTSLRYRTKYACIVSYDLDQICLQSWFKRGPNMPAMSVILGTLYVASLRLEIEFYRVVAKKNRSVGGKRAL